MKSCSTRSPPSGFAARPWRSVIASSFLARPLEESEKVVTQKRGVPASAVVDRAGRKVVFAIDHDHLREVPVRVGSTSGALVELVEGPGLGTKLVAVPGASFVDGQLVKEARNQ